MAEAGGEGVGDELLARGWRQGSLLCTKAPVLANEFVAGPPVGRREKQRNAGEGFLVLATQTCDLKKKPASEPEIECLRAFWTRKQRIISGAQSNSVRHFLLRERTDSDGKQGLVADASARVLITKESLLHFAPEQGCADAETERRFRRWLGRRFDRPAIPNAHVEAVQRPLVEALKQVGEDDGVLRLLTGVKEVLFAVANEVTPFRVQLLFIAEEGLTEGGPLTPVESEHLAAWFGEAIAAAGLAELYEWELVSTQDLSLRDYLSYTPLPLDEYSL